MNKKLKSKKYLSESLDKESLKSEVYDALSSIAFKYGKNITQEAMEEAIEWFTIHFFTDEVINESCPIGIDCIDDDEYDDSFDLGDNDYDIYDRFAFDGLDDTVEEDELYIESDPTMDYED